jgi:hypothetical protein
VGAHVLELHLLLHKLPRLLHVSIEPFVIRVKNCTPRRACPRASTHELDQVHDLLVIEPSKEASEWHERDCVAWSAVPLERLERHQVPRAKPARRLDELVIVTHPRLQFDLSAVAQVCGHSGLILGLLDLNERHVLRLHYVSELQYLRGDHSGPGLTAAALSPVLRQQQLQKRKAVDNRARLCASVQ